MEWVVIISVLVLIALSLMRVNVIFAIIVAAEVAGLLTGLSLIETTNLLISGMGGLADRERHNVGRDFAKGPVSQSTHPI